MDTKQLINHVKDYLIEKYGVIQPQWELVLGLLEDNINLYKQCKASLQENGIYDVESGKKNPLLITMRDTQIQILNGVKELGLSPYASSRIKTAINESDDDFINGLTE
jgi:P27 family predicted phage terminase small subunit